MLSSTSRLLLLTVILLSMNTMMVVSLPVDTVNTMDKYLHGGDSPCGTEGNYKLNYLHYKLLNADNPCSVKPISAPPTKKPCRWIYDKSSMRYFTVCGDKKQRGGKMVNQKDLCISVDIFFVLLGNHCDNYYQ